MNKSSFETDYSDKLQLCCGGGDGASLPIGIFVIGAAGFDQSDLIFIMGYTGFPNILYIFVIAKISDDRPLP